MFKNLVFKRLKNNRWILNFSLTLKGKRYLRNLAYIKRKRYSEHFIRSSVYNSLKRLTKIFKE